MNKVKRALFVGFSAGAALGIGGTFAFVSNRYALEEKIPLEEYVQARQPLFACFDRQDSTTRRLTVTFNSENASAELSDQMGAAAERHDDGRITARLVRISQVQHDFGSGVTWVPYRTTSSITYAADGNIQTITQGGELQRPDGQWELRQDSLFHGSPAAALERDLRIAPAMREYANDARGLARYTFLHHVNPIQQVMGCALPKAPAAAR